MPNVPPPEECESDEDRFLRFANDETLPLSTRKLYLEILGERSRSPIAIKRAKSEELSSGGTALYIYWLRTRSMPQCEPAFQKCILAYMSDFRLIETARQSLGLKRYGNTPDALSMMSSLDHAIYYYSDDFNCGDWLLHVMVCPRTGSGRGITHGRVYSHDGKLIAVTSQEGVVRAGIREPTDNTSSKL